MAAVGAVRVDCIAGLLVAVLRVDIVRSATIPPRIGLHPVSVAHSLVAADGAASAVGIVAVAAGLAVVRGVVGLRIAVLLVAAIVAVSSAAVGAHDLALITACGLDAAFVFAVNGGFEGADGVEGTFPS